jgi:hypothetical protein
MADLEIWGKRVGIGAGIIAIVGAPTAIAFYLSSLDSRVKRLEEQVHTLTVAPLITQAITVAPTAPASPTASSEGRPSNAQKPTSPNEQNVVANRKPEVVANPLAAACRNLADTLAEQVKTHTITTYVDDTKAALRMLGCVQNAK